MKLAALALSLLGVFTQFAARAQGTVRAHFKYLNGPFILMFEPAFDGASKATT